MISSPLRDPSILHEILEKQYIGQEMPLQRNSPLEGGQDKFAGGKYELTGERMPISETPFRLTPINEVSNRGTYQIVGEEAPLDRTPRHGPQSWNTAMSKRDEKESR